MTRKQNLTPKNLQQEMDAQDDAQNVKILLGPNASNRQRDVQKLAEMTPNASAEASALVQMMCEIVVSMREITQSKQKVLSNMDKHVAFSLGEQSVHTNPLYADAVK